MVLATVLHSHVKIGSAASLRFAYKTLSIAVSLGTSLLLLVIGFKAGLIITASS